MCAVWQTCSAFQSTLPARGATHIGQSEWQRRTSFQSTLPARGATSFRSGSARPDLFQSTLPARGATVEKIADYVEHSISIHAPRTGSDGILQYGYFPVLISIHAPRTGSDHRRCGQAGRHDDFNPRSPHGERRTCANGNVLGRYFNPRSPHGERHHVARHFVIMITISIHAPRTGSDASFAGCATSRAYFNPRSPHGERPPWSAKSSTTAHLFQSTLPARGATLFLTNRLHRLSHFNPRSPHGERRCPPRRQAPCADFNPRSPHGERRSPKQNSRCHRRISIHAPRTGSDEVKPAAKKPRTKFQSTLPARGATGGGSYFFSIC